MSYTVYAFVVQGAKVPRRLFVPQEERRGCQHDSWMTTPYCPKCGAKRIASEAVYVEGYDESQGDRGRWQGCDVWFYDDFVLIGRMVSGYTRDGEVDRIKIPPTSFEAQIHDAFADYEYGFWLVGLGG